MFGPESRQGPVVLEALTVKVTGVACPLCTRFGLAVSVTDPLLEQTGPATVTEIGGALTLTPTALVHVTSILVGPLIPIVDAIPLGPPAVKPEPVHEVAPEDDQVTVALAPDVGTGFGDTVKVVIVGAGGGGGAAIITSADELTTVVSKQLSVYQLSPTVPGDTDTLPEPTGEADEKMPGVIFAGAAGLQV